MTNAHDKKIPATMKALLTTGDGGFALKDVAIPILKEDEILVRVVAIAVNHVDCKSVHSQQPRG
jgi:NADPH:quinone reductase-like Zn-dependent oxidoreductase